MSKRLEAMRANPKAGWTIADVKAVCSEFGIDCRSARGGGSHFGIGHPTHREKLTIPAKRPIKPIYIRDLVRFIDRVRDAPWTNSPIRS
jgi:hypothetical protein